MTIYTKQNVVNEEKKAVDGLDVAVTVEGTGTAEVDARFQRLRAAKKRRMCIQFILLMCLIIALAITTLCTIYWYKTSNQKRYKGWCGVKYTPSSKSRMTAASEGIASTAAAHFLDEKVDIDDDVETLKVPKFDDNDEALFVHDFRRNVTVIKDETDELCYILPLDRKKIPIPQSFVEMLMAYYNGDYIPDADEIREDYRVLEPALDLGYMLSQYGGYISDMCKDYKSYKLIDILGDDEITTTTASPFGKRYAMYAGGDSLIQYYIIPLH